MAIAQLNPYTNEVLANFDYHTDSEIQGALALAYGYYQQQKTTSFEERGQILSRIAQAFRNNTDALARMAAQNMGKLYSEGVGEANAAANIARYYADHGPAALQTKDYAYLGHQKAQLRYEGTGIVLAIEPWNFPYTQVMRVFAPNFLLGNPVILKHSRIVAGCANLFEQVVWSTDVNHGAFQNLFMTNEQVADMISDIRVQGVALTGSTAAGETIASLAGQATTKTTLELGGNDAFIVLKDADIQKAVKDGATSRLRNSGQVCTSAKRYIVEEAVAKPFIEGMIAEFESRTLGDPMAKETTLAPMASQAGRDALQVQVDTAVTHGAKILVDGGAVLNQPGNFFKPVLLTNITENNPMYDQEFFGPVGQVYVVKNAEAAIQLANQSQFGLAGAVYSKHQALEVAQQLETGQVFLNQPSNGYPELPFGGVKNSGYGREMSDLALYEFANQKMIAIG